MEKRLLKYEIIGFFFTAILGTILHFAYDFFNQNAIVGIFSPINESTWEHLKLLFWPFLFYTIFEYKRIGKDYDNFIFYKSLGVILGMFSIIFIFYSYTAVLGKSLLPIDILLFYFSVFLSFIFSYSNTKSNPQPKNSNKVGIILLFVVALLFVLFTFYPPDLPVFLPPTHNVLG